MASFNDLTGIAEPGAILHEDGTYEEYKGSNRPSEQGSYGSYEDYLPVLESGDSDGWVAVRGLSGQAGSGPDDFLMHESEFLDDGIIPTLLKKNGPGLYAAMLVDGPEDEYGEPEWYAWVLLYNPSTE